MNSQQTHAGPQPQEKRLYLSTNNKQIAGVCGGLAEYFNVDPALMRVAWIIISVLTGIIPGIVAYIIAAVVMPSEPRVPDETAGTGADQG